MTASSGPGIALKGEAIGLAVMAELPLVIFDIQRGGPSTGLPTKTEQADLMQALYGRNSESPIVVLAPSSPGDCFFIAYEAVRLAIKYMVPVMVLSDGYPRQRLGALAPARTPRRCPTSRRSSGRSKEGFFPYLRDPATLARPWVRPGTPGLEHRIGGIEKEDVTGNISYEPENHDHMVRTRAEKVRRVAQEIPPTSINGPHTGDVLVVGWGGTYGAITAAVEEAQMEGKAVSSIHLRYLNPLPPDLGQILRAVPEGARARDQQRPARAGAARGVPRGRGGLQPRARPAAADAGDSRSHQPTRGGGAVSTVKGAPEAAPSGPRYTKKDFESDQDVRWCPGCGDYAILSAVQKAMPDLGIPKENIVFISGIGCSSRFPYYMNTYGFHTIHGRAPAIATGLRLARPDLKVFVVTGDGDGLSIGGNHILHVLRRNVNVTILLFNNRIYGLTKGQYSPTSELGKVTKSTPLGSADRPVNPLRLRPRGAAPRFVARTVDRNIPHMEEMLKRAAAHKGAAFLEILQNCNVYNDLAWNVLYDRESKVQHELRLEHGKPLHLRPARRPQGGSSWTA